jgi:hypothetical protein
MALRKSGNDINQLIVLHLDHSLSKYYLVKKKQLTLIRNGILRSNVLQILDCLRHM